MRYPFLTYLTALGLAEFPYAIATVYLGDSFLERRAIVLIGLALGVMLLSFVSFRTLHKRLNIRARN